MNANSLSKDIILSHTTCNDIYIKILGLHKFPRYNISSPFTDDKNPSLKIYENGTFKCYSTGKYGDVWQMASELLNLNCKTDFNKVLHEVATAMNIPLQTNNTNAKCSTASVNPFAKNIAKIAVSLHEIAFTVNSSLQSSKISDTPSQPSINPFAKQIANSANTLHQIANSLNIPLQSRKISDSPSTIYVNRFAKRIANSANTLHEIANAMDITLQSIKIRETTNTTSVKTFAEDSAKTAIVLHDTVNGENIPLQSSKGIAITNTASVNSFAKQIANSANTLHEIANAMGSDLQNNNVSEAASTESVNPFIKHIAKPANALHQGSDKIQESKKLHVKVREFTSQDIKYWEDLGVNEKILKRFNVYSISESYFDANKVFKTKYNSISFAYKIDNYYKKYTPEQPHLNVKKSLIPHLKDVVFGFKQLPLVVDNLIICEGEKDVIVAASRGFHAISFGSATNMPSLRFINEILQRCKNLFICYDNDSSGIAGRTAITKQYKAITAIDLPPNVNVKGYDLTDYFQSFTAKDFQLLIELTLKNK